MELLIGIETVLLILVVVLLAGVLRTLAELLRDREMEQQAGPQSTPDMRLKAHDLSGTTLDGEPLEITVATPGRLSLLAFLTSGCLTCEGFWNSIREDGMPRIPGDPRLVIVGKDSRDESLSRLKTLSEGIRAPIILSTAAWTSYGVPVNPYFVLVDGNSGAIAGDGAAESWNQVLSLANDAVGDTIARKSLPAASWKRDSAAELIAAGIGPDHPSLYDPRWSADQLEEGGEETR